MRRSCSGHKKTDPRRRCPRVAQHRRKRGGGRRPGALRATRDRTGHAGLDRGRLRLGHAGNRGTGDRCIESTGYRFELEFGGPGNDRAGRYHRDRSRHHRHRTDQRGRFEPEPVRTRRIDTEPGDIRTGGERGREPVQRVDVGLTSASEPDRQRDWRLRRKGSRHRVGPGPDERLDLFQRWGLARRSDGRQPCDGMRRATDISFGTSRSERRRRKRRQRSPLRHRVLHRERIARYVSECGHERYVPRAERAEFLGGLEHRQTGRKCGDKRSGRDWRRRRGIRHEPARPRVTTLHRDEAALDHAARRAARVCRSALASPE